MCTLYIYTYIKFKFHFIKVNLNFQRSILQDAFLKSDCRSWHCGPSTPGEQFSPDSSASNSALGMQLKVFRVLESLP